MILAPSCTNVHLSLIVSAVFQNTLALLYKKYSKDISSNPTFSMRRYTYLIYATAELIIYIPYYSLVHIRLVTSEIY